MPPHKQSNLNTLLISLSILVALATLGGTAWAVHRYLSPIEAMVPKIVQIEDRLEKQGAAVSDIAKVQHSQTKVLEALADVATKSARLERDVEHHEADINKLEQSVKELEKRMP